MSSAFFATAVTDTVSFSDVTVTIKKLNHKKLREASEAQTAAYYAQVSKAPKGLLDAQAATAKEREQAPGASDKPKVHNYAGYDRDVVLRAGVKAISGIEAKLPAALDDLDEESAKRLHEAILNLSLPPLDDQAEEDARKND